MKSILSPAWKARSSSTVVLTGTHEVPLKSEFSCARNGIADIHVHRRINMYPYSLIRLHEVIIHAEIVAGGILTERRYIIVHGGLI